MEVDIVVMSEVVAENLPLELHGKVSMSFAAGRVIIADCRKVMWVDPHNGHHGEVTRVEYTELRNRTAEGEPIVRRLGSYQKINLDTWSASPVLHGIPVLIQTRLASGAMAKPFVIAIPQNVSNGRGNCEKQFRAC